jgi:branched-chain amino acid transport system permease protein
MEWITIPQQLYNGLIIGSGYALTAVGLTMIFGLMRVINFAHGELYMLGAFILYSFSDLLGLNFFVSLPLTVGAVMLVGLVCERFVVRPLYGKPIDSTILLTIGLSIFLEHIALLIWGPYPKTISNPFPVDPIVLGPFTASLDRLLIFVIASAVIAGLRMVIQKTKMGKAIRATFQNQQAASLVGVDSFQIYRLTFVLGTGLAALGGGLMGMIFTVYPTMGYLATLKAFVIIIMGGLGSFPGAIFGGLILGVAESLATGFISSGYKDGVGFIIVILILLFRPSGLFGKSFD